MNHDIFQIDVREILQSKAPGLYKKFPGFLITALEKLIHQDDINQILKDYDGLTGVDFMQQVMKRFNIKLNIIGEENIPPLEQKSIFASNHPLGGLDGICLSSYLGERYDKHIRYLVNDILYFIQPLQDIFVPINKHGGQAKEAVAILNESFASDNQIITFPAGLCSRKTHGVIRDPEWKKMFVVKAVEFQRDVVPVCFEGRNSALFYNTANIRKQLGIKINIEMLLLPGEMFKSQNKTFNIYFGKPIPWQTFDGSKTPQQWTHWVEKEVYKLKN